MHRSRGVAVATYRCRGSVQWHSAPISPPLLGMPRLVPAALALVGRVRCVGRAHIRGTDPQRLPPNITLAVRPRVCLCVRNATPTDPQRRAPHSSAP
jgi:hypothetical protein